MLSAPALSGKRFAVYGLARSGLSALRFTELSNRQPAIALGVAMGAGAVLAKRLGNRRRRVAAT